MFSSFEVLAPSMSTIPLKKLCDLCEKPENLIQLWIVGCVLYFIGNAERWGIHQICEEFVWYSGSKAGGKIMCIKIAFLLFILYEI